MSTYSSLLFVDIMFEGIDRYVLIFLVEATPV